MIATMTTVGYGDLVPRDPLGRVASSIACIWGIVLLALTCLVVTDHLSLNSSEARLLRSLQERQMGRQEGEAAASLIQEIWRAKLPQMRAHQMRAALACNAAAITSPAARRRLGLPEHTGCEGASGGGGGCGGIAGLGGGERGAGLVGCGGGSGASGGGGGDRYAVSVTVAPVSATDADAAMATACAATGTCHRRLRLLHRVQKQREVRQLFTLEASSGEMQTVMQRLDTLERTVGAELHKMREAQAAQNAMLSALSSQLATLLAAEPMRQGGQWPFGK
uniref:Potassium channel domain-containing protein n=1 Tax=Haptolina brevifila TaxID=156173 RepID=A0A7S2CGU8_9EUKA|mmetsp:Transcript_24807/g.49770  ORF Transcript_24807/g.49770 Transcript_24807/m.49770 type:complete len:279 (+) Transcript_24807:83-919(+)